jgi:zinc protease
MYPADHPYHWPTIGSHEDLEAATVADVRAFFERFYRPSNASLVIAGDFDPAEARRLVERYFGWQPRLAAPERAPAPAEPRLTRDIAIAMTDRVQLPRLRLVWHAPALFAPGDADLDMAAHVLGGGKSSRLYRSLVFEKRIAQDVFAYQGSQMLGSLFQIGATAKPGHDLDELAGAINAEMARLAADGPTEAELARARNTHLADFYKGLDHLQTRADLLNHYQHVLGRPDGVARDVERYERTTIESVRAAFARVIGAPHMDLRITPEAAPPSDGPVAA